ncbi:PREDICTED: DNA repair protein XRCC2 [Thamnophis sirtalis]|uniref:DNA repair protein XRCC2 n=1 Tax=Thamnophis sirtalis TaxID=35019 RepID=A0A6I9Z321_9SAUR|nr:PREDICTED: DNA repair protein XRCC2 [Thamnophis sirtalis]
MISNDLSFFPPKLIARLEGRSSLKTLEPFLFAEEGYPVYGDVVEFHGAEGTGKTEMLYHLIARCILPKSRGGLEVSVLFIDTDFHFDMLRLITLLEYRLSCRGTEATMKRYLERFLLINCHSSSQLLISLYSLEGMFLSHPSLSLLIVDSMSAFYWIDRANGGENLSLQEANLKRCVQVLQKLIREHHLVLFATTQSLMQKSPNFGESSEKTECDAGSDYRPFLCKPWRQLVTHRIFFSRHPHPDGTQGFLMTSCHLQNNCVAKRPFCITEQGIQF